MNIMEETENVEEFFNEDQEWDDEENSIEKPSSSHKGPFGVESVDAIVYSKAQDNPELRLAASYVPISPKLKVKDSKPVKPMKRKYDKWVPGSENNTDSPEEEKEKKKARVEEKEMTPAVRVVLIVAVAIIPLMIGWFLIQTGLTLY